MDDLISRLSLKQSIVVSLILGGEKTLDQIIDEEPTIDAVPAKHGVWVTYTDGSMHCSNCSKIPINRIYALSRLVYDMDIGSMMKYCPNCGADMRGEPDG